MSGGIEFILIVLATILAALVLIPSIYTWLDMIADWRHKKSYHAVQRLNLRQALGPLISESEREKIAEADRITETTAPYFSKLTEYSIRQDGSEIFPNPNRDHLLHPWYALYRIGDDSACMWRHFMASDGAHAGEQAGDAQEEDEELLTVIGPGQWPLGVGIIDEPQSRR